MPSRRHNPNMSKRPPLRLSTDPIPRLVLSMTVPVSIGFFFQTMFNVVDNWAAGRLSTDALAGLSASFPVFFLIVAVSHGCQASANALLSHALGRNDPESASELAGQALFFATWMGLLVGILGSLFCPALFDLLAVTGPARDHAIDYMRVIFLAAPAFVLGSTFNGLLTAHGDTRPFRNSLIVGFLLNIVLDLWFVFGGLGLPAMGFTGIAVSTVLIQFLTLLYMWTHAVRKGIVPPSGFGHLHPRLRVQRKLMGQGFPALFNMLTICAGLFVYIHFAAGIGTHVLAAYGTAMRIEQLALLPTIGLNAAAMTLAGHSFGAGRLDRLRETVLTCWKYGAVIYVVGAPIVALFAPFWMGLFTQDPQVIAVGVSYLRVSMLIFYAFVILFVSTSALQGIQRPLYAIWIGLYRQLLAPLLTIPFLMRVLDPPERGIWWGAFLSVWSGALITLIYVAWTWRRLQK